MAELLLQIKQRMLELFLEGITSAKVTMDQINYEYGQDSIDFKSCQRWMKRFRDGNFDLEELQITPITSIPLNLPSEILLDTITALERDEVEKCQLTNHSFKTLIDHHSNTLPLRLLNYISNLTNEQIDIRYGNDIYTIILSLESSLHYKDFEENHNKREEDPKWRHYNRIHCYDLEEDFRWVKSLKNCVIKHKDVSNVHLWMYQMRNAQKLDLEITYKKIGQPLKVVNLLVNMAFTPEEFNDEFNEFLSKFINYYANCSSASFLYATMSPGDIIKHVSILDGLIQVEINSIKIMPSIKILDRWYQLLEMDKFVKNARKYHLDCGDSPPVGLIEDIYKRYVSLFKEAEHVEKLISSFEVLTVIGCENHYDAIYEDLKKNPEAFVTVESTHTLKDNDLEEEVSCSKISATIKRDNVWMLETHLKKFPSTGEGLFDVRERFRWFLSMQIKHV